LKQEYELLTAQSGEEALKVANGSLLPDLILLDIMMPDIDGYEVCRRLKNENRTMHIPIIFVTALDAIHDEAKGFDLGAVDYITKPLNPLIIKARVKTHLQLKRKTDFFDRLASIDALTEIANRRGFDMTLDKEIRRTARDGAFISLILMDIDFFKKFNDSYGHAAGDECLKKVAEALVGVVKRASDFVARYGGEEFAIILPATDSKGAIHIAEKVRRKVAELNIRHGNSDIADHITLSLGVATVAADKSTRPIDLFNSADASLYLAKNTGRNRVCRSEDK
jgi:diguanylate cyclase (GGDEF)-like protein